MALTARDIITSAFGRIAVYGPNDTIPAGDSLYALAALNALVDQYKGESLQMPVLGRTVCTLVSGTANYDVGVGATGFDVERPASPQAINQVNYIDTASSTSNEIVMQPLTNDGYANLWLKTQQTPNPTYWFYSPTVPFGTMTIWPVPNLTTLQAVMYAMKAFPEFATLSTSFVMPPAYRRMFETGLAIELASTYEKSQVPDSLVTAAQESKATVKRNNYRLSDMSVDPAALGQWGRGWFNIWTGM